MRSTKKSTNVPVATTTDRPSVTRRTPPANAFSEAFLLLQAARLEDPSFGNLQCLSGGACWAGPWEVEPFEVEHGTLWAVVRVSDPVADGGRAVEGCTILAPSHWMAEAVSALRRLRFHKKLSPEETAQAVEDLFALEVETVPLDPALCRAALDWAARMTHSKANDAFNVALAEAEGAELWTTDERLMNRAHQLGATWVRLLPST
jgi:predicted nucleic acid-binding protein